MNRWVQIDRKWWCQIQMFITKGYVEIETKIYIFAKTSIFSTHDNLVNLQVVLCKILML